MLLCAMQLQTASAEGLIKFYDENGVLHLTTEAAHADVKKPKPKPSRAIPYSQPDLYEEILQTARFHARKHRVDVRLVEAVIRVESNFNPKAVSPKGAMGLMQLMPATARRFGVEDAFDMDQNIGGGVEYLAWLLTRYNNNVPLALAGYNAGEGTVARYGGIPPYRETRNYIKKVADHFRILRARPAADLQAEREGNKLVITNLSKK